MILKFAPIWAMVLGVAVFMFFYTIIEMTSTSSALRTMMTAVWFGVALMAAIEMAMAFSESRDTPSSIDDFNEHHRKIRKRNVRNRREARR